MKNILGWIVCAMTVVTSGCADAPADSATAIVAAPLSSQQWTLESVGEWRLPVSIGLGADASRQIRAGRLAINADTTWSFHTDHHDTGATIDTVAASEVTGRYSVEAGEPTVLTLSERGSVATYTVTIREGALDLVMGGRRYHFSPSR